MILEWKWRSNDARCSFLLLVLFLILTRWNRRCWIRNSMPVRSNVVDGTSSSSSSSFLEFGGNTPSGGKFAEPWNWHGWTAYPQHSGDTNFKRKAQSYYDGITTTNMVTSSSDGQQAGDGDDSDDDDGHKKHRRSRRRRRRQERIQKEKEKCTPADDDDDDDDEEEEE